MHDYVPSEGPQSEVLEEILAGILDYACANGLCQDDITSRDIFDTRIMGAITPMPREIVRTFREKYAKSPMEATDKNAPQSGFPKAGLLSWHSSKL